MAVLPSKKSELLAFITTRADTWVDKAAEIGLSSAQANKVKSDLEAAVGAFEDADVARAAAKSATMDSDLAIADLRTSAADAVKTIRNFAERSNDPGVYALAQIPAPGTRGPSLPPGQPTDLRATLEPGGAITLNWKATNPGSVSRVVYLIGRRLDAQTTFTTIDFVGGKEFTDATLPLGTRTATYLITPRAGGLTGPASAQFTVQFGVAPGGTTIITTMSASSSDSAAQGVKLAA